MQGVLLLAAGSGKRMDGEVQDKLLHPIECTNAFRLSCQAFLNCQAIQDFVVVFRDDRQRQILEKEFSKACETVQRELEPIFAEGGQERKDSVSRGVEALPNHCLFVQVHDCAVIDSQLNDLHSR